MSSTKSMTDKQQAQHNQQQGNDPRRMGNKPVEPQKNQRDDRNQSPKSQHDSQGDKPSR